MLPDDSVSCISVGGNDGGLGNASTSKKLRSGFGVDHYINQMDIAKILAGDKLGVQLHHARLQLAKFGDNDPDKARLMVHLQQVDRAMTLSPGCVEGLPKSTILETLHQLRCPEMVPVPLSVKEHLLSMEIKQTVDCVLVADPSAWVKLIEIAGPWGPWPESPQFKLGEPSLSALDIEPNEKCVRFNNIVYKDCLVPLLKKFANDLPGAFRMCESMLKYLQAFIDKDLEDFNDDYLAHLLTMSEVFVGVCAVCSDDFARQSNGFTFMRYLQESKGKAHKTWFHDLANEIGVLPTYTQKLEGVLKVE